MMLQQEWIVACTITLHNLHPNNSGSALLRLARACQRKLTSGVQLSSPGSREDTCNTTFPPSECLGWPALPEGWLPILLFRASGTSSSEVGIFNGPARDHSFSPSSLAFCVTSNNIHSPEAGTLASGAIVVHATVVSCASQKCPLTGQAARAALD